MYLLLKKWRFFGILHCSSEGTHLLEHPTPSALGVLVNTSSLFSQIEADMARRTFLSQNPVLLAAAHGEIGVEVVERALVEYCRLPEDIADMLFACMSHFERGSGIRHELARNIGEERGSATGGVPHVKILKAAFRRDLGIVIEDVVTGSAATETFIASLHDGMKKSASFALGCAFALEATAVPELAILVGPLINTQARLRGKPEPVSLDVLREDTTYPLPTIRDEVEAFAMTFNDWLALHISDFEVGHRDFLRHEAGLFLRRDGNEEQFRAGFIHVLDCMDLWWRALAAA